MLLLFEPEIPSFVEPMVFEKLECLILLALKVVWPEPEKLVNKPGFGIMQPCDCSVQRCLVGRRSQRKIPTARPMITEAQAPHHVEFLHPPFHVPYAHGDRQTGDPKGILAIEFRYGDLKQRLTVAMRRRRLVRFDCHSTPTCSVQTHRSLGRLSP